MADSSNPNVTVLHDYSGVVLEERTRKTGKKVVSMTIESTPILVHHNPMELGKPVAEAIAEAIKDGIKGITSVASKATLAKRKVAADAFAAGKSWATRRYSGGRTGPKAPNQSDKEFNDSGRLADGIVATANPKEGGWTVNTAANRLNPRDFRDGAAFVRMATRLVELVPALRNPLAVKSVVETIEKTWRASITVQAMATAEKQAGQVRRGVLEGLRVLRAVVGG